MGLILSMLLWAVKQNSCAPAHPIHLALLPKGCAALYGTERVVGPAAGPGINDLFGVLQALLFLFQSNGNGNGSSYLHEQMDFSGSL